MAAAEAIRRPAWIAVIFALVITELLIALQVLTYYIYILVLD